MPTQNTESRVGGSTSRGTSHRGGRGGRGGRQGGVGGSTTQGSGSGSLNPGQHSQPTQYNNRVYFHRAPDGTIEVMATHTIDPPSIREAVNAAATLNSLQPRPNHLGERFTQLYRSAARGASKKWLVEHITDANAWSALSQDSKLYPAVSAADPTNAYLTKKAWEESKLADSTNALDSAPPGVSSTSKVASTGPEHESPYGPAIHESYWDTHEKPQLSMYANQQSRQVSVFSIAPIVEGSIVEETVKSLAKLNENSEGFEELQDFRNAYTNVVRKSRNNVESSKDWIVSTMRSPKALASREADGAWFKVLHEGRSTIPAYTKEEADKFDSLIDT